MYFHILNVFLLTDEGKRSKFHFSDANICKSFLLECCPNELLASTVSLVTILIVLVYNFSLHYFLAHGPWRL